MRVMAGLVSRFRHADPKSRCPAPTTPCRASTSSPTWRRAQAVTLGKDQSQLPRRRAAQEARRRGRRSSTAATAPGWRADRRRHRRASTLDTRRADRRARRRAPTSGSASRRSRPARLDYVIQKATEMGAGIIQPVITRFTQVQPPQAPTSCVANAIEAAEQCEVLTVPDVAPEIDARRAARRLAADAWRSHADLLPTKARAIASPVDQSAATRGLADRPAHRPRRRLFRRGARSSCCAQPFVVPISLGPRILRADTAAVAALAVIQAIIGDWR